MELGMMAWGGYRWSTDFFFISFSHPLPSPLSLSLSFFFARNLGLMMRGLGDFQRLV